MIHVPRSAIAHGWSIIAVNREKKPWYPWKPFQSRRATPEELAGWARDRRAAGWAVVCGAVSGIVVLDFDGEPGNALLAQLKLHVRTGRGGHHVYFRHPGYPVATLNSKSKRALGEVYDGLDIRADGGYAVFLGNNKNGAYRWLRKASDLEDIRKLPRDLRQLLNLERPDTSGEAVRPRASAVTLAADLVRRAIGKTSNRNDDGMWLACQLRDAGLSRADAEGYLRQYQTAVTGLKREPYAWHEARLTLDSAFSRPAREPLKKSKSSTAAGPSSCAAAPKPGQSESPAPVPQKKRVGDYELREDGIVWWKGDSHVQLCNFQVAVTADITRDDGSDIPKKGYRVWAKTVKGGERTLVLTYTEFREMEWPLERLDFSAIVYPNQADRLRVALQSLGMERDLPLEYVYSHTGWNARAKGFLHAGGMITADGAKPAEIDVDPRFQLPEPPSGGELRQAVRDSLEWLNVADSAATLPLFAAIWRAPLGQPDCALWIAGKSGNGKSNLAAIAQQFFGPAFGGSAGRGAFPTNWEGTANAREFICHANKDVITVVDDFMPRGSSADVERLHKDADRLLRSIGNAAGRDRLNGDMHRRQAMFPRGMVVITGEDVVKHKSAQARCWIVELGADLRGNMSKLTPYQLAASRGVYARAMSAYIRWLAPQVTRLAEEMVRFRLDFRESWAARSTHSRTPDNVASLGYGMHKFLDFAVDEGVMPDRERGFFWKWFLESMEQSAKEQEQQQATVEPTKVYLELLRSALQRGQAHVCAENGTAPPNALMWGWDGQQAKGSRVGFLLDDDLYIDPQSAWTVIQREGQQANTPIHVSQARISRELAQAGLLKSHDEGRFTIYRQILGIRQRFLHFAVGALYA
jgi:hypothetical protein